MPTVSGFIRTETGAPALGATVQAFDKDLRHEQLLGAVVITETTGHYQITYTADRFRRAEKKNADLFVLVSDAAGNLRAESEIRFNASDNERIDLTFGPLIIPERPRLSELEQLQESIEPVREDVAYDQFTDTDLAFLTEEAIRAGSSGAAERRTIRQRLEFLRLAEQFALQTGIPLPAFYGWFRQDQPQILDELLDVPTRTLRAALTAAIRANIIPDITAELTEILERLGGLRFEHGRLVTHRFVVQLINAATNRPLTGHSVAVSDPAAEPEDQQLGIVSTDGRGACVMVFSLPVDAPANATRRLQLRISDEGAEVADTTIDARANQAEVAILRVRLRDNESGDIPIEDSAPPALAARLRQQGIRTLRDVLAHPEVVDEDDAEALEQLRASAKFAILAANLGSAGRDHLLSRGYRSLLDVGATSRAEFVGNHHQGLGSDAETYATHFAARETGKVLYHMIGSAWLKQVTTPGDEPDPDIPTGVNEVLNGLTKCGCKDCNSAVSPAAYLAHLLEWTLEHIKDGTASISFSQMEEEFHQPFGDLPASCTAVEAQVRQVRICVETLWRFTGFLDRADLQLPTPFRTAYRHLRNQLYRAILTQLGTSFEQLRKATLQVQGDNLTAELVAAQRRAIADVLGIDETHVNALFFNIEQPPVSPSEDELQQRFGFKSTRAEDVFASTGTPDLVTWQRERLEAIWQQQDWPADAYGGDARLPFVDPALIDESYLRTPLAENAAFALLEARRDSLDAHLQTLVDQDPQQNGLADLLESELGQSIEQLRTLYATLQAGEQSDQIAQAHETIIALHLTPAGFTQLMGIDARFEAGEPIGATPEEVEAAWESVFDILSAAHRRGLFPAWVEEENDVGLIFGPKLFWLPVEPPTPPNPWQAAPSERAEWQEALRRRSARPIIDPDQILANYVILILVFAGLNNQGDELPLTAPQPPLGTMALWQQRRAWIDGRLEALLAARQNQANPLAILQAVLSASTIGIGLDAFAELANMDAEGRDLSPRLAQLNLTTPAYRFLAEIRQLAQGNASVSSDTWQQVDAILVEAEKYREFAEWRLEEQAAEITLHPHRFVVPKEPKPEDDSPQLRWLHDPIALQEWVTTLEARADQLGALREGLNQAVSSAEEAVLPLLRNILIMQTVADGDSLLEKAEWLDQRLLVDMRMDGCQMTTRVSQAIETLQRFIRGVYTQEHPPLMQHLTLDAEEDYEAEWPVLGSYATWRAFMLAYLFPENLLHLSPPSKISHGFAALKKELPAHITPAQACEHAKKYSSYFQDICGLEVQATCQIETVQSTGDECEPTSTSTAHLMHVFAYAKESGYVYWAHFDPTTEHADTTSTWTPLGQMGQVDRILGATPHLTPSGQRCILLFAVTSQSLLLRKFDVDNNRWLGIKKLAWPPGYEKGIDSGAVIQKRQRVGAPLPPNTFEDFKFPTLVAVGIKDDASFIRRLRADAEAWDDTEDWFPLYGPMLTDKPQGIKALIQVSNNSYVILADVNSKVHYRTAAIDDSHILHEDDFEWKGAAEGPYRGAFVTRDLIAFFCLYKAGKKSRYTRIDTALQPVTLDDSDFNYINIVDFNDNWLMPNIGISLDDTGLYPFDKYAPEFFIPADVVPGAVAGLHPLEIQYQSGDFSGLDVPLAVGNIQRDPSFTGSLLGLITRSLDDFDNNFLFAPPDAPEFYLDSNDTYFYLVQQKYYGVQEFINYIQGIEAVSYFDRELGWWKYANDRVKELSENNLTLAAVIEQLLVNQLVDELALLGKNPSWKPIGSKKGDIRFRQRAKDPISSYVTISSSDDWTVPPHSGEESVGDGTATRVTVVQQLRETSGQSSSVPVRATTRVIGTVLSGGPALSATAQYELAPFGSGPFDILPVRSIAALQKRREDLKLFFSPLKGAPLSVRNYLHEAFFLVPIAIAQGLKQAGHFEDALGWYRLVFDYLGPESGRKIYFGLVEEEKLSLNYGHAEDYLNDASNAHAIAATRENTLTRHVLLLIIRCLIDNADALFSHDNTADNARARELYSRALRLLALKELKPGSSSCAKIIGQLEIEVVDPGTLPLQQFKLALAEIPDPDHLSSVVTALRTINQDTSRPIIDRLSNMRETLVAAVNELPPAPRMTAVLATKRQTVATLENQFLADQPSLMLLTKTHQHTRQTTLARLSKITDRSEAALLDTTVELPWLRLPRREERDDTPDERPILTMFNPSGSGRLAVLGQIKSALPMTSLVATHGSSFAVGTGISFDFCIPQNPAIQALRTRAENNLNKLRSCRNIAGFLRQLDPYGAPIGIGSGMVSPDGQIFSGIVDAPPTPYRYVALVNRAKELVGIAQQMEAGYQAALENAEREALSLMQAEQSVELAGARVSLQDLRVTQANGELRLAQLQTSSALLRESTYAGWITAGASEYENQALKAYQDAGDAQQAAAKASAVGAVASAAMAGMPQGGDIVTLVSNGVRAALSSVVGAAAIAEGFFNVQAIQAQTSAQVNSTLASFERREQEWQLQQGLAALDGQIGDQQIVQGQSQIDIVQQERIIAGLEQTHAVDILNFLLAKTFTEEMYRWIASVLEDVYRFFLQEATVIARVAERQLAFERPEAPLKVIQSDYWNVNNTDLPGANADRLGLTGSARLLKDLYQLDNFAFNARKLKQALTITLDLAAMFPLEFQQFRETGVLIFNTSQSLIDRQLPGYYLCLVQQVSVSVVALIPPTYGIRATLTSAGISRAVIGGDTFQTVTIRNLPERMALTSASTTSGPITLEPDSQSLLNPFEGSGFDTLWELRLPKAANPFDYDSMATVLFTVSMTALHSFDYEREVIQRLDRKVSFDRAFDFRQVFPDPWYDLNNPDQTETPMAVRLNTRLSDFPPNLSNLAIQHVVLYLVRKDGEVFEQAVRHLHFTAEGMNGPVGGPTSTVGGRISTRSGNGTNWLPMIGLPPMGQWELAFPNTDETRNRFRDGEVENILLVLTCSGLTAAWPT